MPSSTTDPREQVRQRCTGRFDVDCPRFPRSHSSVSESIPLLPFPCCTLQKGSGFDGTLFLQGGGILNFTKLTISLAPVTLASTSFVLLRPFLSSGLRSPCSCSFGYSSSVRFLSFPTAQLSPASNAFLLLMVHQVPSQLFPTTGEL